MYNSSVATQEPSPVYDLVSRLGRFALSSGPHSSSGSDGHSSFLSNFLYFDAFGGASGAGTKPKVGVSASLSLSSRGGSGIRRVVTEFNRAIRFHCDRFPIGFASVRVGSGDGNGNGSDNGVGDNNNVLIEDGGGVNDNGIALNGVEAESPKKVLILMSDTGGGHRASAEAIKAAFNEEFGDEYQVFVTDLWSDHTPWPFNQLPRSYNFLVKHGPLWKMTYYGTAPRLVHQSNFAATSTFIAREVAKGLMKYQPDIIISVHPLMQHVPLRVLRGKGLLKKIVFTTVVTDLSTCHPTWFHKLVTRCYCPTTEVAKRALKAGLQTSQIKVYGLPVRPNFVKPVRPKAELRRELRMEEDLPAVLLMGGGEGMGPIEATARALGDALYDENLGEPVGQVLVICGHNKKLANKLLSINWKIPVQVKGFVTKMEECMGACDCIITKAGPGTIAEAMIRGLPIILNDYIAGQEVGNVPYVVENGCGKYSKSPKKIARIVADWFGPKANELKAMSENALKLAKPDSVFKIVHDLHELVRQRRLVPQEVFNSKWKIKKELTAAEAGGCCLYLDMNDVETHIFRYWDRNKIIRVNIDSTPIRVKDVDTNTVHVLHFRIYKERRPVLRDGQWVHPPPSPPLPSPLSPPSKEVILGPTDTQCPTLLAVFEGHWRLNFIERRSLGPGDQIGIYYDKIDSYELCFSVLSRRESYKELGTQFGKNIPPCTRGRNFDSSTPSEISINKKRKGDIK